MIKIFRIELKCKILNSHFKEPGILIIKIKFIQELDD